MSHIHLQFNLSFVLNFFYSLTKRTHSTDKTEHKNDIQRNIYLQEGEKEQVREKKIKTKTINLWSKHGFLWKMEINWFSIPKIRYWKPPKRASGGFWIKSVMEKSQEWRRLGILGLIWIWNVCECKKGNKREEREGEWNGKETQNE